MAIRNAAKALVIHDGRLLLNICRSHDGVVHYTLPGGGQNQYETMAEAVVRECLEETGYLVHVERFAALYESILSPQMRRDRDIDYTHKIYHVFICRLEGDMPAAPSEPDSNQLGSEWVPLDRLAQVKIVPMPIAESILSVINGENPVFLGSEQIESEAGLISAHPADGAVNGA